MDTANSLPIVWVEKLVDIIYNWKRSGAIRDKEGLVDKIRSVVNQMKYSYLEPDEISSRYVQPLEDLVAKVASLPMGEKQRRFVSYVLEEVEDLPRKLRLNPSEPYQVFRYRFVVVVSVTGHPSLEGLKVTRVRDKHGVDRTIVTNLKDVKEGKSALIVLLPPKEFDGVWSEGMFVQLGVSSPEDVDVKELKRLDSYFNVSQLQR